MQTVRELLTAVNRLDKSKKLADEPKAEEKNGHEDFLFRHSFAVSAMQRRFRPGRLYTKRLGHTIEGEANVPQHVNFIVAPNHASHIDTGLVNEPS